MRGWLSLIVSWFITVELANSEVHPHVFAANSSAWTSPSVEAICIVVRTYWGHGGQHSASLKELLLSLQRQSEGNWEALIVVLDSKPFPDLARILQDINDDRVWVYAEWVGKQFTPKANGYWTAGYHGLLYDLTDEALRACPPHTRWALVTNGDNEYASTAFAHIIANDGADVVAFDFYSRYQRATGPPCQRFTLARNLPPCKVNKMRWCHTDLGANALNWPRLIRENRRFGHLGEEGANVTADNFDGVMAELLHTSGWRIQHLHNTCLFEHDPSPQRCARSGGVWDDTLERMLESPGGACVSAAEADAMLAAVQSKFPLEDIIVNLSHDGRLGEYLEPGEEVTTSIRCLRDKDTSFALEYAWKWFGLQCSADIDLPV